MPPKKRTRSKSPRVNHMVKEVVKLIYRGEFGIDENGRFHSYYTHSNNIKKKIDRIIDTEGGDGYPVAVIRIHKKNFHIKMHRLLWYWHYGELPEDREINHIDGTRTNNNIHNLELVTHRENALHAVRIKSIKTNWESPCAKLKKEDYRKIKELIAQKVPGTRIAKMFHITSTTYKKTKKKLEKGIEGL
jgi:hypothetical protein